MVISNVKVDRERPSLLHRQVAAAIRDAINNGEVRVGERLPPARDLAGVLGVNQNTVLKSLRVLRDEGVLEFRRGRGVTVIAEPVDSSLMAKVEELVAEAESLGMTRGDLFGLIDLQMQ
ncbi:MAG: GntR family transcriptional regulator [Actinomycetes bacterium]